MATAITGEATVTGRVRPDGTLELDGAVPLDPGPVRVIVQRRREVRSDDTRSVLERIREQRQAAGIHGRTKEEIDAAIDALRDESESELREVNDGLFSSPSAQEAPVTNQSRPPTAEAEQIKRALERAASRARELAQRTGTPCYVIRDGRMVDAARENASQATPDSAR